VTGISLFVPITSKEKLIVVTPCSTPCETARSRLPVPRRCSSVSQCCWEHHPSLATESPPSHLL